MRAECPLCCEIRTLRIVPCSNMHAFCSTCIRTLMNEHGDIFPCPNCRKTVNMAGKRISHLPEDRPASADSSVVRYRQPLITPTLPRQATWAPARPERRQWNPPARSAGLQRYLPARPEPPQSRPPPSTSRRSRKPFSVSDVSRGFFPLGLSLGP
jgi:hypothetical protein